MEPSEACSELPRRKPRGVAKELVDRNGMTGVISLAPSRDRGRVVEFQPVLTHQHADQRRNYGLGHGEAEQLRIDADALRVALGDEAAILDDGDRPRAPGWLTRQLGKGAIECRGKLRVLRRHHRCTRDFGKQSGRRLASRHGDIDELFVMIERTAKSVAVDCAASAQTQ